MVKCDVYLVQTSVYKGAKCKLYLKGLYDNTTQHQKTSALQREKSIDCLSGLRPRSENKLKNYTK